MARGDGTVYKYTIMVFPKGECEPQVTVIEGTGDYSTEDKIVIWEGDDVVFESNMEYTVRRKRA